MSGSRKASPENWSGEEIVLPDEYLLLSKKNDAGIVVQVLDPLSSLLWEGTKMGLSAGDLYATLSSESQQVFSPLTISSLQEEWFGLGLLNTERYLPHSSYIKPGLGGISIRTNCPAVNKRIEQLYLPCLPTSGGEMISSLEVIFLESKSSYVINSSRPATYRCTSFDSAIGTVLLEVTQLEIHQNSFLFIAHAAAVTDGKNTFILPARAGSGKSTLTARLLQDNYKLINDDMVPVNEDGTLTALNLPLKIKEGSWDVLNEAYPELPAAPAMLRDDGIIMKQLAIPVESCVPAGSAHFPTHLFVPRFTEGGVPKVTPLSPSQGLAAFLSANSLLPEQLLSQGYLQKIIDWATKIPAFELTYANSEEAMLLIESVLEQTK